MGVAAKRRSRGGSWLTGMLVLAAAALPACASDEHGVRGPASGGLVFVQERDGLTDLARARISDGAVVRITDTRSREERWPYWSSIAQRVVFQARPYGRNLRTDLYLWDPATGEEIPLTQTPKRDERWPTWSPTGPELAYAFKQRRGASGVALYDVVTHRTRFVAAAGVQDFFLRPSFAPDGRQLVAQRRAPNGKDVHLWLLAAGREPRALTRGAGVFDTKPLFTPDGASVIFTRRAQRSMPGDIARIEIASGELQIFASDPAADDHSAKQSPTRSEVVFVSDRAGSSDIFLLEFPDGAPRNLTRSPELDEGAPIWSPDGERIVMLAQPRTAQGAGKARAAASANMRLVVIDRSGRVLFETPGMMADWMPAWP